MKRPVLFLDDGGVLNDNEVRGAQWMRLVADFFMPRLGGAPGGGGEANRQVITSILAPREWEARLRAATNYESFERAYYIDWLAQSCALVGVPRPSDEERIAMGRGVSAWIIPQIRSAYPGAVEAIRLLHDRGYTLHTASGASSTDLGLYLEGMGVLDCFGHLYGPDLVGVFKVGPEFYERIFADAGVAPGDALVVDDSLRVLEWARAAGARVLLTGSRQASQDGAAVE